jgi:5-methyltetrahydropteroyltriglutamate--homocysteine methyltransferase
MSGVRREIGFEELIEYRKAGGMQFRARPPGVVDRPLGSGTLDLPSACAKAKALATKPLKFTVTGPHMLAKTLLNKHYRDTAALAEDIAQVLAEQVRHVDADVIQIDEANLPGHADEWKWASAAVNRVLDAVKGTPSVHLCFGNYGGQSIQKGSWSMLMDYLNSLHVDHVVLESAHRPLEELAALKDLRAEIGLGLGVVDVKRTEIETPEQIARQIERAQDILGAGRITYVHPDCGFWMLKRSIADGKIRALVKGRDLFEGRA